MIMIRHQESVSGETFIHSEPRRGLCGSVQFYGVHDLQYRDYSVESISPPLQNAAQNSTACYQLQFHPHSS